jgi:hypothetical protein
VDDTERQASMNDETLRARFESQMLPLMSDADGRATRLTNPSLALREILRNTGKPGGRPPEPHLLHLDVPARSRSSTS